MKFIFDVGCTMFIIGATILFLLGHGIEAIYIIGSAIILKLLVIQEMIDEKKR